MTYEHVPDVWVGRWKALHDYITQLGKDSALAGDPTFPRGAALQNVIGALIPFAQSHFDFFSGLFQPGGLNSAINFPNEFVMRQVINRIADDAQVIQNCIDQRRAWKDPSQAQAQKVLLQADNLAWAALRFAVNRGLLPAETTAITYFQKNTSIRVIPYASVALIGIPITCLENPIDFLSIPHEIGHYVYWNSGIFVDGRPASIQSKLTNAMKGEPYWLQRWKQEVFADTYGALVAQAAIACSFQDLEYEGSKTDLMLDDKKHPAPIVRPDIYNEAVRRHNSDLAASLSDRWGNLIQNRHSLLRLDTQNNWAYLKVHRDAESTDVLLPGEIRQNYNYLLDEIDKILPPRPTIGAEPDFPARGETNLANVYDTFRDKLQPFIDQIPAGSIDTPIKTQLWEDWVTQFDLDAKQNLVEKWMNVFLAGGWTTEGPQGRDLID